VECVEEGKVSIAGDSAAVGGLSLTIRKDRKVFRNGDFLIGGTTSFRMLQLLNHAFVPPGYPSWDEEHTIECYMATTFVNAVRDCLKAGGFAQKSNEQESGGMFLVGFQGRLFCIYSDYQVQEALDGYDAIGCGSDIALGVLYATPTMKSKKRLELALQAAEHHSAGVRAPFIIEESL
jgi:ATP-dependent protease HslVU (ClpYQ) peptidase subunit